MEQHYIFGYGSLISTDSRRITGDSGEAVPVRVQGIQRDWNRQAPHRKMSYVGAVFDAGASCNGVIIPIPTGELDKFDIRESGYDRVLLEHKDISTLDDDSLPEGNIWTYINQEPNLPSEETPIVQSYLDVILSGCLGISRNFAEEFIGTTGGWGVYFNDRDEPRYSRLPETISHTQQIDELLESTVL